ncbi:MAG: DUF2267 domain-containing protein [Alphaproteobacteria bacterium]|nr:DUF2267 domain-containing protein [Alphaproteobacteria bacterium]
MNPQENPDVFDKTLQTTNLWLKDIMDELGPNKQRAYHALAAVLHALRDRLTPEMAAHLSAQLPMLVRGIFFDQWHPAKHGKPMRSREEFIEHVSEGLKNMGPVNVEDSIKSVFRTIDHYIDPNEIEKVKGTLPQHIKEMWV